MVPSANALLSDIMAWGDRWQVKFAPDKTQAMVVTRSHVDARELHGRLRMGDNTIPLRVYRTASASSAWRWTHDSSSTVTSRK